MVDDMENLLENIIKIGDRIETSAFKKIEGVGFLPMVKRLFRCFIAIPFAVIILFSMVVVVGVVWFLLSVLYGPIELLWKGEVSDWNLFSKFP